jgi:hypothetical protein
VLLGGILLPAAAKEDAGLKLSISAEELITRPGSPPPILVSAIVTDNGKPVQDVPVAFAVNSTAGSPAAKIFIAANQTNERGQAAAQVYYQGNSVAIITVTAAGKQKQGFLRFRNTGKGVRGDRPVTRGMTPLAIDAAPVSKGSIGRAFSSVLGATGGTTLRFWSIVSGALPAGLSLNSLDGTIAGMPAEAGTFAITVEVSDSNVRTARAEFSINVDAPPLSIETKPLALGRVGQQYYDYISGYGGLPAYAWSKSGNFPPGLNFTSDDGQATITGYPTLAGTYTFTVSVYDSSSPTQVDTETFTIYVSDGSLAIETEWLSNGAVSQDYSHAIEAAGGVGPYNWSATGNVPPGLSLQASTANYTRLSGRPTLAGTYNFTVSVSDSSNPQKSDSQTYTVEIIGSIRNITVNLPSPVWTGDSLQVTATVKKNGIPEANVRVRFSTSADQALRFTTPEVLTNGSGIATANATARSTASNYWDAEEVAAEIVTTDGFGPAGIQQTSNQSARRSFTIMLLKMVDAANGNADFAGRETVTVVGREVKLSGQVVPTPPASMPVTWTWTIASRSHLLKNYELGVEKPTITLLPESDLNLKDVVFFWLQGGSKPIQLTATVGQRSKTASGSMLVKAPQVLSMDARMEPVQADNSNAARRWIGVGNPYSGPTGIVIDTRVAPEGCNGVLNYFETVNFWMRGQKRRDGANIVSYDSGGSWVLNTRAPLNPLDKPVQDGRCFLDNSPGTTISGRSEVMHLQINAGFKSWAMFKPSAVYGMRTIWVPIGKLEWAYAVRASRMNGNWKLTTGTSPTLPTNPQGLATSELPTWSNWSARFLPPYVEIE